MKTLKFDIPLYNIHVDLVQVETKDDKNEVISFFRTMKCEQKVINEIADAIERGCHDGGDTFRNMNLRKIFVLFYPIENEETRAEIYAHEKRHIEDRVMEHVSVNDIESAGLLAGYLGRMFYRFNIANKSKCKTTKTNK